MDNPQSPSPQSPDLNTQGKKGTSGKFFKELLSIVFWSLVIVVPFRIFIAQPFIVNGASMDPTFKNGDYLIVDEITYRFEKPQRGSVLIFKFPLDTKKYFIKRIIGLPGEHIEIKKGVVTITKTDGSSTTLDEPYVVYPKADDYKYDLGENEYFVMGDNRLGSADSRIWGPVKEDLIIGRPVLRLYPVDKISKLPGNFGENEN